MQGVISVFLYLLRLALCLSMWSVLEKFGEVLTRRCILLSLVEMFCKYLLGLFGL